LTNDETFVRNVVEMTSEGEMFANFLNSNKKKLIFGGGIWGKEIVHTFQNVDFTCFVDNKMMDSMCEGIPVISFQEYLKSYKEDLIIISSRLYYEEIYTQLIDHGVRKENILNAGKIIDDMSKRQYFDLPEIMEKLETEEVFVDAGSFDGRTAQIFAELCQGKCKKIYAFEPDDKNGILCEKTLAEIPGISYEVVKKGLWNESDVLHFTSFSNGASKVDEVGTIEIPVIDLDSVAGNEKVTFIKMDIEGSEYCALEGAKETIRKSRPKLAISIYHKSEDIWMLPLEILKINPDYTFYLRHYSIASAETVLFAV
jgi:FkbM family methyltransferase